MIGPLSRILLGVVAIMSLLSLYILLVLGEIRQEYHSTRAALVASTLALQKAQHAVKMAETCITGGFLVEMPSGNMGRFAEVQLCGRDLSFTSAYDPNLEVVIRGREREIATLKAQLEEAK